jgi:hypothetical protein
MFSINKILLYVLLAAVVAGCDSKTLQQDPVDNEDADGVELTFDLNVSGSRSADGSGYGVDQVNDDGITSDGTYDENYIDPSMVRVFFSTGNSSYGGAPVEFTVKSLERVNSTTYRVRAATDALPTSTDCRVFVTANWPYDPGTSSTSKNNIGYWCITQGSEYQYHYGTQSECLTISGATNAGVLTEGSVDYRDANGNPTYYTPSAETPMPMFGIKTLYGVSSYTGKSVHIGTIYMIRSMAKIIVMSDCEQHVDEGGDEIESVTLGYSYDCGLCAPAAIFVNSETENIDPTNVDTVNVPRVFSAGTYNDGYNQTNPLRRIKNLPFKKLEGNKFLIYMPSYNNVAFKYISDTKPNYMTLKMAGSDKEYTVEFKDNSGNVFNICRNYMYIFGVHLYHKQLKYNVEAFDEYTSANISFD